MDMWVAGQGMGACLVVWLFRSKQCSAACRPPPPRGGGMPRRTAEDAPMDVVQ
jgi:hypothetical protein